MPDDSDNLGERMKTINIKVASADEAIKALARASADQDNEYHIEAGDYLDLRALTTLPSNAKLTAGGGLDLSALTHKTDHKGYNPNARSIAMAATTAMFSAIGYSIADGILSRVVQVRGNVSRVVICGKDEVSYLVTDGEAWSHGKTLAEARDGLMFKIGKRDTTEFKAWTLDKVVTKRDAIRAYRMITGACEGGVRAWLEQRQTPDKITVRGIVELTKGAYGADAFANFFNVAAAAAAGQFNGGIK